MKYDITYVHPSTVPPKVGRPWPPELDQKLREGFLRGDSFQKLCDDHGRNQNGIVARLLTLRLIRRDPAYLNSNSHFLITEKAQEQMSTALTPAIIDMLTTQYVRALQNDVGWHDKARAAIARNDPDTFDRVTLDTLVKGIHAGDFDDFDDFDWTRWIVAELRIQMLRKMPYVPEAFMKYLSEEERLNVETNHSDDTADAATYTFSALSSPKPKDITMNTTSNSSSVNTIPFATRHEIFGQDTRHMSEGQLIEAIKKIEGEIANLGQVKTASKKIEAKKAELTAMLASVVEILDAK